MEKFLFKKIELWIVLFLAILGITASLLFSSAVRHYHTGGTRLGDWGSYIDAVASFPESIYRAIFFYRTQLLAHDQRFTGESGFKFNYATGTRSDYGYVLVNRYDGDHRYSVSELWDLNTQQKVHAWRFDAVEALWKHTDIKSAHSNLPVDQTAARFRSAHAWVSPAGDVFTHSHNAPLIKANLCSALSIFQDKAIYHHSIEADARQNLWVPNRIEPRSVAVGTDKFMDDGIVQISPEGKVLFEKSVVQILEANGLRHLIYGTGATNDDPIHLNDIEPVTEDGRYWRKGDVFLSLRHQSMIMLYRPATNQVIWHQQGPWIHQHDVNILNDHQISIFNNDAVTTGRSNWVVNGVNKLLVYDFDTRQVSSPWQAGFERLDIRSATEGRGQVVGNEVFVEETNFGRLVQFSPDGAVSWQFINRAKDGQIYLLNWSRLVPRKLGDQIRTALSQKSCP